MEASFNGSKGMNNRASGTFAEAAHAFAIKNTPEASQLLSWGRQLQGCPGWRTQGRGTICTVSPRVKFRKSGVVTVSTSCTAAKSQLQSKIRTFVAPLTHLQKKMAVSESRPRPCTRDTGEPVDRTVAHSKATMSEKHHHDLTTGPEAAPVPGAIHFLR